MRMATKAKTETARRRPTNVSLSAKAVAEAKTLGVNVSKACEAGLLIEVKRERERRWLEENAHAIAATNRWVEENGLPFADRRAFRGAV